MNKNLYDFGTVQRWGNSIARAVQESIVVGTITEETDAKGRRLILANVLGRSGYSWYDVLLELSSEGLRVSCNCRAGANGVPCKHVAGLLLHFGILPKPEGIVPLPRPEEIMAEPDAMSAFLEQIRKDGSM